MNFLSGKESNNTTIKKLCPFKEKCYRKNPIHFEEMSHPHLEQLLNDNLNGPIVIPTHLNFDCQDKSQLMDQLKILQKILQRSNDTNINHAQSNASQIQQISQKRSPEPSTSDDVIPLTPKKYKEEPHQSSNNTNIQDESSSQQQKLSIFDQFDSSNTHETRIKVRNHAIAKMKIAGNKIPHLKPIGEFALKYALSMPYNIFLSCVENAKETHSHQYSITFPEILDISLGEIEQSFHINFMVDIGWLCLQYLFAGQNPKSLILLGQRVDDSPIPSSIQIVPIKTPTNFGTHHSKISVLKYRNGGVRIIISTANLYADDWENRTQALWISPHLPKLSDKVDKIEGESRTDFKHDFIDYLSQYNNTQVNEWIKIFERLDFSEINVFFISSVPGNHQGINRDRWGLRRLRCILTEHAELPSDRAQWPIVAQASSIGSLGPNYNSWLAQDFIPALSSDKSRGIKTSPNFRFIYPSINNYKNSYDKEKATCCLPYSMQTHNKQKWFEKYIYQWKSTEKSRDRAMPHSKIYTRLSPDMKKIPWMVLTSGNLSKAAWGCGKNSWTIFNYEAGVVLFPQFITKTQTFPICDSHNNTVPPIPLPFDVPLTPYNSTDTPFVMEFFQM